MGTVTLTDVTTGAPILASNLNNGWSALRTTINGGLDETNFASGQLYSLSKLKQDGAATNDVLYWTGSTWDNTPLTTVARGSLPVILERASATVDVTNTITETTLATSTITGGVLSTNRALRLTMIGDIAATGVVGQTWRVKFGGNTLWGDQFAGNSSYGATKIPWVMEVWLVNVASTSIQVMTGYLNFIYNTVGSVAGYGAEGGFGTANLPTTNSGPINPIAFGESVAAGGDVDTTTDRALAVTVQHASASTQTSVRRHYWVLELI